MSWNGPLLFSQQTELTGEGPGTKLMPILSRNLLDFPGFPSKLDQMHSDIGLGNSFNSQLLPSYWRTPLSIHSKSGETRLCPIFNSTCIPSATLDCRLSFVASSAGAPYSDEICLAKGTAIKTASPPSKITIGMLLNSEDDEISPPEYTPKCKKAKCETRHIILASTPASGTSTCNSVTKSPVLKNLACPSGVSVKLSNTLKLDDDPSKKILLTVKSHMCTVAGCEMRFKRLEHLKRHLRVHTMERPFSCSYPGCGKPFSRQDNLRQHTRTHQRRHTRNKRHVR